VLLNQLERSDPNLKENKAIIALRHQIDAVQKVKTRHPRPVG